MSTTHFEKRFETFSFGCLFFITDLKYGSGADDRTGLPFVYANMELESAFLASTRRKINLYKFPIKNQDRIKVSAEILFPSKIYESDARKEQDRVLTNKENFGTVGWHRKEDASFDHDVYVNINLSLPKEMLSNILLLRKENSFYAEISYWRLEEKLDDEPPEYKFIVNGFHIREMHTYYYDQYYSNRHGPSLASSSLLLKVWRLLKRLFA